MSVSLAGVADPLSSYPEHDHIACSAGSGHDWTGYRDEQAALALEFAKIARDIQCDSTKSVTLARVVEFAVTTVAGAEQAAITVVKRGRFDTIASTDDLCLTVDQIQHDTGEGPCVESMTDNHVYCSNDLRSEPRFAVFASRAVAETGVLSMLSFRLFTAQQTLGALNLYSTRIAAYDEQSLTRGAIFATHAALALDRAHEREEVQGLERALETNRQIAMAMGIVMADRKCAQDQAFAHLRNVSQSLNRKLRDIAAEVVETGEVPLVPAGPPHTVAS